MGFARRTFPYNRLLSVLIADDAGRLNIMWQEAGGDAYNYDREEPQK
jgi:hypothetical protein